MLVRLPFGHSEHRQLEPAGLFSATLAPQETRSTAASTPLDSRAIYHGYLP